VNTKKAQRPRQSAEELFAQARSAPLPGVDLNEVWQRLETPERGHPSLGWGWAVPIVATAVVGALYLWPVEDNSASIQQVHMYRPEFSARQFNAQEVVAATPPKSAAAPDEVPTVIPETVIPETVIPETEIQALAEPVPELAVPIAVVEAAPAVRPRVSEYQPRAIREFRRIDWQRWSNRALPAAVAEMVRLKDSKGLLAALDAMPLRHRGSDLLILRGRLRAQADRCVDARADLAAYPGDTHNLFRDFCAE
jgi:hypothetical protein